MLTKPSATMIARPQVLNAYAEGAGRGNDDTAILQALMDEAQGSSYNNSKPLLIELPWSESGYNVTGLDFKSSNTHLAGIGGPGFAQVSGVTINFIGDGADEAAIIRADKAIHNANQNYQGNSIRNLVLDGQGKALFGFKANGWTRYCHVQSVVATRSVCQFYIDDGFYSIWDDVECQINQATPPAGMLQATFDTYKFGAHFHVCHAMHIKSLKLFEINGTSGNNFDAALRLSECDAAKVDVLTVEGCDDVRTGIDIAPGCIVHIDTVYAEDDRFTERWCRVNDNAQAAFTAHYVNSVQAPILFDIGEEVGVVFNALNGMNLDCATAAFNAIGSATVLRNVRFAGPVALQTGNQSGTLVDAGATEFSSQGIPSDGILLYPDGASDQLNGYDVAVGTTYVQVGSGSVLVKGQPLGWARVSGIVQRLWPDLTYSGTWNVKVSGCGMPYLEKALVPKVGSSHALLLGTFTTPGSGGAPADWTPA